VLKTNAELLEYCRKLEQLLIEHAAKLERLRLDVEILRARVTLKPPPKP
jgi:hypothetical protein